MLKETAGRTIVRIICCLFSIIWIVLLSSMEVTAKPKIRLSTKSKTVTEGQMITVVLEGVPASVNARELKWKVSNTDVANIKKKSRNKAKIKVWEDGDTIISVTYKKKKYKCRIKVVCRDYYDGENDAAQEFRNDVEGRPGIEKPSLNASEVELHYIADYAIPYIGKNPSYNYSFRFRVRKANASSVKWSIEGDKSAKIRYRIREDGVIYMFMGNDFHDTYSECRVVATLEDGSRLTAKVRGYDDCAAYIRKVFDEFKETYITPDMSEYEKMDKVAWYLSSEYDYQLYQDSWYQYIITGRGDCMASRWAVMHFCRELGLKAAACPSIDSHGMTVVRADGKVYVVTTGFTGKKPRYYEVREITRETFDKINKGNNIDPDYIWEE